MNKYMILLVILLSGCRLENFNHDTPEYYYGEIEIKPETPVHAVPEPYTMSLFGIGLYGLSRIIKTKP